MASPYLLIGAFPQLIRLLPKPGAWMDTFKQAMGFVLLGTVVFSVHERQTVDLRGAGFCIAHRPVAAACWWIGRTPLTAELTGQEFALCGLAAAAGCGCPDGVSAVWPLSCRVAFSWQSINR